MNDDRDNSNIQSSSEGSSTEVNASSEEKDTLASEQSIETDKEDPIKKGSSVKLDNFMLKPDELIVENFAKEELFDSTDGTYTVALNTKLNPDLISEGLARDIIHAVQNLRKNSGLNISDRILLWIHTDDETANLCKKHFPYISSETLAVDINNDQSKENTNSTTLNFNRRKISVYLKKYS